MFWYGGVSQNKVVELHYLCGMMIKRNSSGRLNKFNFENKKEEKIMKNLKNETRCYLKLKLEVKKEKMIAA